MSGRPALQKVLVIGSGGAGKTTLSKELAARTGLPLIHLDRHFWRSGWVPTPDDEWDALILELIQRDAWIMDGNYGRTLAQRLAAADTIIYLDVPPLLSLWRIMKRRWQNRGRERDDVAPGCPEQLSWQFVHWVWTFRRLRRPGLLRQLDQSASSKRVVILRNSAEVRRFLDSVVTA